MKMIMTGRVLVQTDRHVIITNNFGTYLAIKGKKGQCIPLQCLPSGESNDIADAVERALRIERDTEIKMSIMSTRPLQKQTSLVTVVEAP